MLRLTCATNMQSEGRELQGERPVPSSLPASGPNACYTACGTLAMIRVRVGPAPMERV